MSEPMTTEEILAAQARADESWRWPVPCLADSREDVRRLAADLLAANARCAAWERLYGALKASSYTALDTDAEGAALDALTSALADARALGLDV